MENDTVVKKFFINEWETSVRLSNCLKNGRVDTLEDLMNLSPQILLKVKNFGRKSLLELDELLFEYYGMSLLLKLDHYKHKVSNRHKFCKKIHRHSRTCTQELVFSCLTKKMTTREIAKHLGMHSQTVRDYKKILRELNISHQKT